MTGRGLLAYLAATTAVVLAMSTTPAFATFQLETNFKGEQKLFFDGENKKVDLFSGEVGSQKSGIFVNISTIGKVDTGNGFSNIVPVKDGELTTAIFTPANPERFDDFSLRGQLVKAGTFTFVVQDDQGNPPQSFVFDSGKDDDFTRVGLVSFDGETIKSVAVNGDFKEMKQIEFSVAGAVPEPQTWALMLLGFGALGFAGYRRRRTAMTMA